MAGAASLLPGCQIVASPEAKSFGPAKNLIFLVADGLCHGTLGLAHHWKLRHEDAPLHWMQLFERADMQRAYQDTASASSPVTDSAAAASAWGSGQRVNNGAINMDASAQPLKPIFSYAREAGKATGLVSTCRITHATSAGFSANSTDRNDEDGIARQYLEREIDVLLGGGSRHFEQTQADGSVLDLRPRFQDKGYDLVSDAAGLALVSRRSSHAPLLGLFAKSHIPYAIDRRHDRSLQGVPGLGDMFRAALARLDGMKANGFVLQVEGGRIDHAGHANDPAAILHDFLEFDECIPIALEYIASHPDTLLIVTTDHGTGGCQLDGAGPAYAESGPALDRINQLKHSFEWLQARFRASGQFDPLAVQTALGIKPTEAQAAIVQAALDAEVQYLSTALTEAFGGQLQEMTAVGWSSDKHTSECVDLFAFGPGARTLPPFIQNNQVFGLMMDALGLRV